MQNGEYGTLARMSPATKTSIWFLGTSAFAIPSLEALIANPEFSVDLVITQPNRPAGRKKELLPPPVKIVAEQNGLKIIQPENINHDSPFSILHSPFVRPDYLVVVSFGQILSQQILDIPRVAPVNIHGSLLPRFRGASPIHHAILAGDRETGVTVQRMVKELDAGPILAQERTPMDPRETYASLHDRLASMGAQLLLKTLASSLTETPQNQKHVTVCRKLTRADGTVDPMAMTAEQIDRKVRALNPWPGVTHGGLKILETALTPVQDSTPLPCTEGTILHLVTVQPAGKKPMTGAEWSRGKR